MFPLMFFHTTHFLTSQTLPATFPFSCFNSPLFYVFLCTWRTKHLTKHKPSSFLQHLLQSEDYGNSFFSWIIAALHSILHLLPRPISCTETRSKKCFCDTKHHPNDISSQREREAEGERENFLFSCFQLYLLWDQPFNPSLIK